MATEAEIPTSDAQSADQGDGDKTVETGAPDTGATASETVDAVETQKAPAEKPVEKTVEGPWGDDWRQKITEDKKELKRLERMRSPQDLWNSFRSMENEYNTRKADEGLPDEPTDEQLAAYRDAKGIPKEADGYLENLPDGLVIGDDDKPIVDDFLKRAHAQNASPAIVQDMLSWYYGELEERQNALADEDKRVGQVTDDELRAEWGGEYRSNMNAMRSLLDSAPGELGKLMDGARLADGSPLMGNADAVRWMVHLAHEMNPAGTVVPGGTAGQVESLNAKKAELESLMRTDRPAYNKRKAEYHQVLTALEKIEGRSAA